MVVVAKLNNTANKSTKKRKHEETSTASATGSNKAKKPSTKITKPTPSASIKVKSNVGKPTTGPIHAQRKFAVSSNNASSNNANSTTSLKPSRSNKGSAKALVLPPSPNYLQTKRPKTEDFLTFLCYRGTPLLPPELSYFNYPDKKDKSPNDCSTSASTKTTANNNENNNSQSQIRASSERLSTTTTTATNGPTLSSSSNSNSVKKSTSESSTIHYSKVNLTFSSSKQTNSNSHNNNANHNKGANAVSNSNKQKGADHNNSTSSKNNAIKNTNTTSSTNNNANKISNNNNSSSNKKQKTPVVVVEKDKKAIEANLLKTFCQVKNESMSKGGGVGGKFRGGGSGKAINEQDARFALSALKDLRLKYQEKRLANAKTIPVTQIAKKVKDRTVTILTRSKSKTKQVNVPSTKVKNKGKGKAVEVKTKNSTNHSINSGRNIPSPDIIYGVKHSENSQKKVQQESSSSSSKEEEESENSNSSNSNSSSSSSEEAEEEETKDETESEVEEKGKSIRSLRSGKIEVVVPKLPKKDNNKVNFKSKKKGKYKEETNKKNIKVKNDKKKSENDRRIGTRSRKSASPLKELPMYALKEKKKIKKKVVKNTKKKKEESEDEKKNEKKPNTKTKESNNNKKAESGSSSNGKDNNDKGGRPTRRTKENAAMFLDIMTKAFSSDEEDEKLREKDNSSSSSDTDSSETNYLEKSYNASLKRIEQSYSSSKSTKKLSSNSSSNTKSAQNKSSSSKGGGKKSENNKPSSSITKNLKSNNKQQSNKKKEEDHDNNKEKTKKKVLAKRNLRSDSLTSQKGKNKNSSNSNAKKLPNQQENNNKRRPSVTSLTGAARKSASFVARKNSYYESSDDEMEKSSSSEEEEEKKVQEVEENIKIKSPASSASSASSNEDIIEKSDSESSSSESEPESDQSIIEKKRESSSEKSVKMTMQLDAETSSVPIVELSSSEAKTDTEESESSADEEEEEKLTPKVKVTIGIQVDMDEEEEINRPPQSSSSSSSSQTQETQCQTNFTSFNSSASTSTPTSSSSGSSQTTTQQQQQQQFSRPFLPNQSDKPPQYQHQPQQPPPPPPPPLSQDQPTYHHTQQPQQNQPHYSTTEYYSALHVPNTPLVSNIQFVRQEFSSMNFPMHMMPLSLPLSPLHSFANNMSVLAPAPPPPPLHFSTSSLQTQIRSVANNLDISLVRPTNGQFLPIPIAPHPYSMHSQHRSPQIQPLARPIAQLWTTGPPDGRMGHQGQVHVGHHSAFRVPMQSEQNLNFGQHIGNSTSSQPHHVPIVQSSSSSNAFTGHNVSSSSSSNNSQAAKSQSVPQQKFSINSVHLNQHHQKSNSNNVPRQTNNSQNYSILHNLPNVSIVPKFDRNSSKNLVNLPTTAAGTSVPQDKNLVPDKNNSNNISITKHRNKYNEPTVKKESNDKDGKEKKRKKNLLPPPSSPLTVRKDSNPSTYVAKKSNSSGKKLPKEENSKKDVHKKSSSSTTTTTESSSSTSSSTVETFTKLLQLKKGSLNEPELKKEKEKVIKEKEKVIKEKEKVLKEKEKVIKEKNSESDREKSLKEEGKKQSNSNKSSNKSSSSSQQSQGKNSHNNSKSKHEKHESSSEKKEKKKEKEKFEKESSNKDNKEKKLEDAPAFYPDDDEFQDPLKYIESIRSEAEKYGLARIIPPSSFRPDCSIDDDMRFTAYNHYIHRMFNRFGPNVQETLAIRANLKKLKIDFTNPMIGGMEVDLYTLHHTVLSLGGIREVIEKQKWNKVSDHMHIPKTANDRASKLDSIYVKYVLPYATLSESERKSLLNQVEKRWIEREKIKLEKMSKGYITEESESDEDSMDEYDECISKGKSTPLSSYYRVARNTHTMIFHNNNSKAATWGETESEYWKLVRERNRHVCVYSGSVDCAGVGWGFPLPKSSKHCHPWNLKAMANSNSSILKTMGPVMGANVPTLHVGMIFTTYCWFRDPHGLPWIEYLHTGANKIWYSVPEKDEETFRKTLKKVMPLQCKNKKIWLASDSAMVPPETLLSGGVPLIRAVQNSGEFIVVFPRVFTSSICTGYVVSESICFAPNSWIKSSLSNFKDLRESKEPPVFAIEKLYLSILKDNKVSSDALKLVIPQMESILKEENLQRKKLKEMGLSFTKIVHSHPEEKSKGGGKKNSKKEKEDEEVFQCDKCNYILHISMVNVKSQELYLCLSDAIQYLSKYKSRVKTSKFLYEFSENELKSIMEEAKSRLP